LTVSRGRVTRGVASVLMMTLLAACELEEITVVNVEDVVVAEIFLSLEADPDENEVRAFLHRTVGVPPEHSSVLSAATVTVVRSDGAMLSLRPRSFDDCVLSAAEGALGACFVSEPGEAQMVVPGDRLEVTVELPDGSTITGGTSAPGEFEVVGRPTMCRLNADVLVPVTWTSSEGAWAYLNETSIRGLREALAPENIEVDVGYDPLYLLGLSISDADTMIVFPSEFGLFNRFELDQAVSVRLQRGLPVGSSAEVTITAVDRNYVNWVRGGRFNPSGQVRVPSLSGGGTGVFGSSIVRRFEVFVTDDPTTTLPDCPGLTSF
jgi:hypothetical protein